MPLYVGCVGYVGHRFVYNVVRRRLALQRQLEDSVAMKAESEILACSGANPPLTMPNTRL